MGRHRANAVADEDILRAYEELKSTQAVSERLHVGSSTVLRVLGRYGVTADGRDAYYARALRISAADGKILREKYEAGASQAELVSETGQSGYSVRMALIRAGAQLRDDAAMKISLDELVKIRQLAAEGCSQVEIAATIGRGDKFVRRVMRMNDIVANGIERGRVITGSSGYWAILIDKIDPLYVMRNSSGYVLEHRLIMARHLGRPLMEFETVHHIDGNRLNNDISNLQLRIGKHGFHIAMRCSECGSHKIEPYELADPEPPVVISPIARSEEPAAETA